MKESLLNVKSKEFALQTIKLCNQIKSDKKESVLTNKLIRSGTSSVYKKPTIFRYLRSIVGYTFICY